MKKLWLAGNSPIFAVHVHQRQTLGDFHHDDFGSKFYDP
jgi:hypothetical protein